MHISHHIQIRHHWHYPTAHIPHCISTIISHQTVFKLASDRHYTSFSISHLASQHTTIFPVLHTIIPHRIIWHCTTSHLAAWPHHRHIRMNKAHLALQNIPHHAKFHSIVFHITPCDMWSGGSEMWYGVMCRKCGLMWCGGGRWDVAHGM